ncbi:hypothetical protein SAMN05216553_108420 [Lentzea fradiae]|uniref:UDP-N-acetylglucosamine:LPS N-acetylglucosamine transferase n=1 Tax=Lentzea fradiae TaxID=200378 RepID=A0A1G7UV25_9PSEU|nr:hypothetical protein [Lentzea fradiae]SDG51158.1 hypothetical protein SAMN05216553_108420 [Lentzea fradiae]
MTIAVLTSGVALGVHVPGLLLARRLAEAGVRARVDVLERHLPEARRDLIPESKVAFHRDFRVALAGQRLARRNPAELAEDSVSALLAEWEDEQVDLLVVLSGFWLPAVRRYASARAGVRVHACHVDSTASPSFRSAGWTASAQERHEDVWLLEQNAGGVATTIPVSRAEPVPWSARNGRLLAHGGGWGMGTYRSDAADLTSEGFALDLVAYEWADVVRGDDRNRYFMIDPAWHPWHDDGFPPFGRVAADGRVDYRRREDHHDGFDLTREAIAVVSKPGGGTLMDSLSSATPVVLLKPFGEHEARNAQLWERLGFGISYPHWVAGGKSLAVLEGLHRNLLAARPRALSYPDRLAGLST